ncbi:MAG: Bug family tripartite tricarboxylate transporter substrate binding protein [Hylemonella sp.]|uniref:Bug family tripartite tricarboxylate transporter substrate binding protein n=1 Tax=Hylemonella sp. TaxID=2066020 RepID=UPI00391AC17D
MNPIQRIRRLSLLCAATALLTPAMGQAQTFPDKPITFIVPFAAGSATDQLARAVGLGVTQESKQSVVIENKPGANAFIGAQAAKAAKADGYTVFITTNTTHAANEHLFKKLPYDPVKDYEPVTSLGRGGQIMVVNPSLPVNSVAEFVQYAKARPGKLSFGSGSSSSRIAGELFKQMTGTYIVNIPYRSNPPAVTDLIGGQIDVMITDMATGLPQVKAGKLKALGVSTKKRSPLAPEVPTIDEAGVKGYEMTYWFAAYVPAGTPAPVVKRLNELLVKAAHGPAAAGFFQSTGTEIFTSTAEELRKFQAAESQKWGRIIKSAGIEPE